MTRLAMMMFLGMAFTAIASDQENTSDSGSAKQTTEQTQKVGEQTQVAGDGVRINCTSKQGTKISGALQVYRDKKGKMAIYGQDLDFYIPKEISFVPLKFKANMIGRLENRKMAVMFVEPKTEIKHKKGSGKVDEDLRLTIRIDSKNPSIIQNANIEAPIIFCECRLMDENQIFMLTSK